MRSPGIVVGVLFCGLLGWSCEGVGGGTLGLAVGMGLLVVRYYGLPLWRWATLYLSQRSNIELAEHVTVANDRCGGGVRFQNGCATVAVHILGKPRTPTFLTGTMAAETEDTLDLSQLYTAMHQSLGLRIASINVISSGVRRHHVGDYPRIYDTLIGTPPYAGRREMWLVIRFNALENADALRWRTSVGTAAIASAQRISASLRFKGIRAKVATVSDLVELESRLGRDALAPVGRSWRSVRTSFGWLSTYAYEPGDINTEVLTRAWALRADEIIQNVELLPDQTVSATVTVRTAHRPSAPPSVILRPLLGEQAAALARNLGGPYYRIHRLSRCAATQFINLPVGSSGVLLGKLPTGVRLLLPFSDPGDFTRIDIAADDAITKRFIIRAAAAGDRITVHTRNSRRWESIRMPNVTITDESKPARGTTLSVVDGTVSPTPRPNAIMSVSEPGATRGLNADIEITQVGPGTVLVDTAKASYTVEVEFFRAENRYTIGDFDLAAAAELEFAE